MQLEDLRRQLAAAQSNQGGNVNEKSSDFAAERARYEREMADLRKMLSEARSEKFGQAPVVANGGDGSATYNAGAYFRDRHRNHHINVGGDMRFA